MYILYVCIFIYMYYLCIQAHKNTNTHVLRFSNLRTLHLFLNLFVILLFKKKGIAMISPLKKKSFLVKLNLK